MAGLIQRQMGSAPGYGDDEVAQQVDDDAGEQDDPNYQAAIDMARQVLYADGAARDVAQALRAGGDPVEALANTAYEMVVTIDEKTDGAVPDEMLVSLAAEILGEVADIGEAAGVEVKGAQVAAAMRQMLLRYLGENGVDASQLQQAMGAIDPAQLGQLLDQAGAAA